MAIFHCAVSHGSRKAGQSGAAKVDYIMRCGKYRRDPGEVLGACTGHLPSWAGGNPRVFFAAADKYERSNGRLFTQVIFAIPNELSDEDALLLGYYYAEAVTENGAPYALAVHRGGVEVPEVGSPVAAPEEADEADLPPHNRHGHLLICERIDDGIERTAREWFRRANRKEPALGGAAKDRGMNGGNWVPEVRHLCADYINYGLERAGFSERVTCESHETRIARAEAAGDEETAERLRLNPPGIHLGPTAWAIEQGRRDRPGRASWRGDLNRGIQAEAAQLRQKVEELNAQWSELDVKQAAVDEKLAAARQVAAAQFARREEALLKTEAGVEALCAARVEVVGDTGVALSVVQQGEVVELAEEIGSALDAGVEEIESVYAAARSRTADPLSALSGATEEKRRQIRIVSAARSALLTDAAIESIRVAAEGERAGSGWAAVHAATAVHLKRKEAAESAAEEIGLYAGGVYARAQEEAADAVAMLEQATGVVRRAREAGLGIDEIDVIREEAEKRQRGSEWLAVEEVASARVAGSRIADPVAALEEETARQVTATARRSARRQALFEAPGGREAYVAALTARDPRLESDALSGTEIDRVLTVAEAADAHLERVRRLFDTAGRAYYGAAVRALGKRYTMDQVVGAVASAEGFAGRVNKLSAIGRAALDTVLEGSGEVTVKELVAAVGRAETQDAERGLAAVERLEAAVRATKKGPAWLADAERRILAAGVREPALVDREHIAQTVAGWIRTDLEQRKERVALTEAGARFLRAAQDERAARPATLAEAEQQVEQVEQRLLEHNASKARRAACQRELYERPGGKDLYFAVLTGLDPKWRDHRDRVAVRHIDGALDAAASDSDRLGRLRDALADPNGAACYRAALAERGDRFTVKDIDASVEAVFRWRERESARQREEEDKREREARARRAERVEALSAAGRELYAAHLIALAPAGAHAGRPAGPVIDRALEATGSDARLPRLEAVFGDAEQRSYYRAVLGSAGEEVTLEQLGRGLEGAETFKRRKQTVFEYPGNSEHPAGGALYAAALKSRAPGWPGAELAAAVFDDALADVESQLAERVRLAADEFERLLPTTQSRVRPHYHVPALSDALVDQLAAKGGDGFIQATVAEVRERYARRARYNTRDEDRYGPRDRLDSERGYLAAVIEMTWDRERRLWSASSMTESRPTRASALARVLKKYMLKVWKIFQVACDKVLGGDLGERLQRHREQVERAADVAERLLPTATPSGCPIPVPATSDQALVRVATDDDKNKNREVIEEVVEAVWERLHHRSRHESYEQRYDADDRRRSEETYLATALEITQAHQERVWHRSSLPSPRPTLASARQSVLEEHQSYLREIFEVAYDEVFGRGEVAARWRCERDQVRRAVDAAEAALPASQPRPVRRPGHHVPALSDDTLDELVAETDPFLKKMYSLTWERFYRRASLDTPYEQRYGAVDRRRSELEHLNEVIAQAHDQQMQSWRSSRRSSRGVSPMPTLASAQASVLKGYRAQVHGIFTAARDEVLRSDELQDRQREQSVRPGRAAPAPLQSSSASLPGRERKPHGEERERGKQQEQAGQDSRTGRGSQGERPRAAATPEPEPAVSVTEADRVRLAVHDVAAKLPWTQPYAGDRWHRPPALSAERFTRLSATAGDEFTRKVIAGVKQQGRYTDWARAESEEHYLRPAVDRKHQEALAQYEAAEAKRRLFSRRRPKPTREAAKAAVIEEFEAKQLGVIQEVCREVRQKTGADVSRELGRFESWRRQVIVPKHEESRTRSENQQDRGYSGPSW